MKFSSILNSFLLFLASSCAGTVQAQDFNPLARVRLEVEDSLGNAATSLVKGNAYTLTAFVLDLRSPEPSDIHDILRGVFGAYVDIRYEPTKIQLAGPIEFNSTYPAGTNSYDTLTSGLIDDVGGFQTAIGPLGLSERELFSVPVRTIASGTTAITIGPANSPGLDVLLIGMDRALLPGEVLFVGQSLFVAVPEPATYVMALIGVFSASCIVVLTRRKG